jgi:hypothetical protein
MKRITAAAAALALAACGSHGGNEQAAAGNGAAPAAGGNASASAAPAAAASGGLPMQPGAWQMTVRMEMPNMPPEVRAHLGEQGAMTRRVCTTSEALSDANRMFFAGGSDSNGAHCDSSGLRIGGGRIDGTVACTDQGGQVTRMTIRGTLGATAYEIDQHFEGASGELTAHVVAQRVGDCTAQETAEANANRAPAGTQ